MSDNILCLYLGAFRLDLLFITANFNMYLVINKCVTAVILSNFSRHYLRNRSTSDIGVFCYIGVL